MSLACSIFDFITALSIGHAQLQEPTLAVGSVLSLPQRQCPPPRRLHPSLEAVTPTLTPTEAPPTRRPPDASVWRHLVRSAVPLQRLSTDLQCPRDRLAAANPWMLTRGARDLIDAGTLVYVPTAHCLRHNIDDSSSPASGPRNCRWRPRDSRVHGGFLRTLMASYGFVPPRGFRMLVVKTVLTSDLSGIDRHELYDYGGRGHMVSGWNPASTVKLFSGIAAVQRIGLLGFGRDALLTFHYRDGPYSVPMMKLLEKAMHISKNLPHNRLVQLAGFNHLNGPRGTLAQLGLKHSYVMRAYAAKTWTQQGHDRRLWKSYPVTISSPQRRAVTLQPDVPRSYPCRSAACTSLSDLARSLCGLMMMEKLPPHDRLRLGSSQTLHEDNLELLRNRLNRKRLGRLDPVWKIVSDTTIPGFDKRAWLASRPTIYRKSGYSMQWASDALHLRNPSGRVQWTAVMACHQGRYCLSQASEVLSAIISHRDL